jgi:hypothetical protein
MVPTTSMQHRKIRRPDGARRYSTESLQSRRAHYTRAILGDVPHVAAQHPSARRRVSSGVNMAPRPPQRQQQQRHRATLSGQPSGRLRATGAPTTAAAEGRGPSTTRRRPWSRIARRSLRCRSPAMPHPLPHPFACRAAPVLTTLSRRVASTPYPVGLAGCIHVWSGARRDRHRAGTRAGHSAAEHAQRPPSDTRDARRHREEETPTQEPQATAGGGQRRPLGPLGLGACSCALAGSGRGRSEAHVASRLPPGRTRAHGVEPRDDRAHHLLWHRRAHGDRLLHALRVHLLERLQLLHRLSLHRRYAVQRLATRARAPARAGSTRRRSCGASLALSSRPPPRPRSTTLQPPHSLALCARALSSCAQTSP